MGLTILLMFLLLSIIDSLVGKRLEPGYNVAESDGRVKFRVGGLLIVILFLGSAYTLFDIDNVNHAKWLLIFFMISFWGFQSFMEWKYVEGKKYKLSLLLMILGVISVFVIYYVHDVISHSTFGEEISELLEGGQSDKIVIFWPKEDKTEGDIYLRATITDQAFQNKLITESSDMELIKSNSYYYTGNEITITFLTDHNSYILYFNEKFLQVNGDHFLINGENKLLNLIEEEQLEWVEE